VCQNLNYFLALSHSTMANDRKSWSKQEISSLFNDLLKSEINRFTLKSDSALSRLNGKMEELKADLDNLKSDFQTFKNTVRYLIISFL